MPGSCLATHISLLVHLSIISAKGMWCLPTSHFVNPVSGFLVLRLLQLFPRIPAPILATRSTTLFVLKAAPLHRVPLFLSPLFGRRNFYLLEPGGSVNPVSARFDGSYDRNLLSWSSDRHPGQWQQETNNSDLDMLLTGRLNMWQNK